MLEVSPLSEEPEYFKLRDRLRGGFVMFVGLVISFGTTLWAKEQIRPRGPHGASISRTKGVVGFPMAVDGVKSLAVAQKLGRGRAFRGMILDGVKSDGTLNLAFGRTNVKYVFQANATRNTAKNIPNQPAPPFMVCPRQVVKLKREGMIAEGDRPNATCPSELGHPLQKPRCGAKEVWEKALAKGASKEESARLEFYQSKVGPAWRFQLPRTQFAINLSDDCKREIRAEDAVGRVP
jgi:hypothetical protein